MVIYYIIVMGLHGIQEIEIDRFPSFPACESFMRKNHKRLVKEYFIETQQRMTGSGCKVAHNG